MRLSEKQQRFTWCIAILITYSHCKGYGFTMGDGYRDPRVHGAFGKKESYSASYSTHKVRLGQDLNLFIDGEWIAGGDHPVWRELGEFWETLDKEARWGGPRDANHFSFEHQGWR